MVARLTRAISASDLTIAVDDAGALPPQGKVQIDSEKISYLGKSGNVLTGVTRGVDGTTATSHAVGSQVLALLAAPSVTPRATATEVGNSGSISVTGNGGGCSLAGTSGSLGGVGWIGAALALAAGRRTRAR